MERFFLFCFYFFYARELEKMGGGELELILNL